jgi:hypothetical protein
MANEKSFDGGPLTVVHLGRHTDAPYHVPRIRQDREPATDFWELKPEGPAQILIWSGLAIGQL